MDYSLAVIIHNCRRASAPDYLTNELNFTADQAGRSRLRSAWTPSMVTPRVRRPNVGGRAFPAAAARVWNALPLTITMTTNTNVFKHLFRSHLHSKHFPDDF